jgi:hypothetical protein
MTADPGRTLHHETEQLRLVKAAFAFSCWMKGDGHNQIEFLPGQPDIGQCLQEPATDEVSQMDLPAVFQIMNHLSDHVATAISRYRRLKMKGAIVAIRAFKASVDRAEEWLGTPGTEGR